jgi:hypothetical protein
MKCKSFNQPSIFVATHILNTKYRNQVFLLFVFPFTFSKFILCWNYIYIYIYIILFIKKNYCENSPIKKRLNNMDKMCDSSLSTFWNILTAWTLTPHSSNSKLNCANPHISFKQPKVWVVCVHAFSGYKDIPPIGRSPKDSKTHILIIIFFESFPQERVRYIVKGNFPISELIQECDWLTMVWWMRVIHEDTSVCG